MYKSYVKMSPKKYKNLEKGKTITLTSNNQEDDPEIELEFNTRKVMNKVHRNLAKGSGVRIKQDDIKSMRVVGGSINIGRAFRSFGKSISKSAKSTGRAIEKSSKNTGRELKNFGNKAGNELKKAPKVLKQTAFKVNKALKGNAASRAVIGTVVPELAGLAMNAGTTYLTGNPELGKIASKGAVAGTKAGLKSEGYGLRKLVRGKLSPVAEGGSISMSEAQAGTTLGGINSAQAIIEPKKRGRPRKSGGAVSMAQMSSGISIGGTKPTFSSVAERMAFVRSKRKLGGSFSPMGGSFKPL